MAPAREPSLELVDEVTSYCPGDYVPEPLVLHSERIVAAKQSPGDCVGRNNEHAAIAAETHAAVDRGAAYNQYDGDPVAAPVS